MTFIVKGMMYYGKNSQTSQFYLCLYNQQFNGMMSWDATDKYRAD